MTTHVVGDVYSLVEATVRGGWPPPNQPYVDSLDLYPVEATADFKEGLMKAGITVLLNRQHPTEGTLHIQDGPQAASYIAGEGVKVEIDGKAHNNQGNLYEGQELHATGIKSHWSEVNDAGVTATYTHPERR